MPNEITNAPGGQTMMDGGVRSAMPPDISGINVTPSSSTAKNTDIKSNAPTTTPATETREQMLARANSLLNSLKGKDISSASSVVTSDEPVVKDEKNAATTVNNASKVTRDTTWLDKEIARLDSQLRQDVSSINKGFDSLKTSQQGQQASEVGQTSAGLAAAGGYLGFSGSGTGVMLNLAKSHRSEMQALEAKRQQAIADARNAAASRRFDVVRLKAQEIKDIEQEQYNRDQDYFKQQKEITDKVAEEEKVLTNQKSILDVIQKGSKTPDAIFSALKGTVDLDTINSVIDSVTPKTEEGFKYSRSEVVSLLGSGLSQDDISALNETVNSVGYTDEVRAQLPASVRVAADKIYRAKTGTGASSGGTSNWSGVSVNGKKISSTTMQVLDGFTSIDKLTPTAAQEVRDDMYAMGFASDTAPDWFTEDMIPEQTTGLSVVEQYVTADVALGNATWRGKDMTRDEMWDIYKRQVLNGSEEDIDLEEIDSMRVQLEARSR